jgi:small subunit ribosomal protein S16
MAVKLRLARIGKRRSTFYRLVAIDEHKKREGRVIETLGTYDPHAQENKLKIKKERLDYWISVGAKPTATVSHLLQ